SAGKRIAKRSEKWIGTMYTIRKNQTAMKSTRKAMKSFGRWRIGIYGYMGGGGGAAARVATRIWVCGEEWASRLHPALAGVSMQCRLHLLYQAALLLLRHQRLWMMRLREKMHMPDG